MTDARISTEQKAFRINLDGTKYGTFAEIGGGQEVARWFFRVGGASGTVAKTMSAYDTRFSDAIYGPAKRYVSPERVERMLDHEYGLLLERLDKERGATTRFFAYANSAATRGFKRPEDGLVWMGLRFQARPREAPSQIMLHARLLDGDGPRQQEAIGLLGVNLVYGALFLHANPDGLLDSLADHLDRSRLELNALRLSGPAFKGADERVLNLRLVLKGHTDGVAFDAKGRVSEPSSLLRKKAVLALRGTFRPVTRIHMDILESARAQFLREAKLEEAELQCLCEITTRNLLVEGQMDPADFLSRVDTLAALRLPVLVSSCPEFYRLAAYLARHTTRELAFAVGCRVLIEIFDGRWYGDLPGGLLEAFGRLFHERVRVYAHPKLDKGGVVTAGDLPVPAALRHLYLHLLENGHIRPIERYDKKLLSIRAMDVLKQIREGTAGWEALVPEAASQEIKRRGLFSAKGPAA